MEDETSNPFGGDAPAGDAATSAMPEIGGGTVSVRDALEAAGVKAKFLDELSSALDAWKGGDDAALQAFVDKKNEKPKVDSAAPFGDQKKSAVKLAMGDYES